MKKSLFFAFAVAGMLCSCSSEEAIEAGINGNDGGNNSELVPIKLGMSNSVITRGSGTVGGTDTESNVWNGQPIHVFMVDKFNLGENGELKLALDPIKPEQKNCLFDNQLMYAPTGVMSDVASIAPAEGVSTVRYYPTGDGAYSFFAYHVDADEEIGTENSAVKGDYVNENGKIYFNIEIDGSQDVMVAKADDANEKGIDPNRVFSAYAARNEIQPNLLFKHLLTRLQFNVTPMGSNKNNITIKRIAVKSKTTGQLIVAYTGEELEQLVWTPEQELSYVNLKQRSDEADKKSALIPLNEFVLDENGSDVGEALLVSPESNYYLLIELSQEVDTGNGTEVVNYSYGDIDNGQAALMINPNEGKDKFEAGHSYKVSIKVYGLEKIVITTTLEPWISNAEDDVDIDPEA